MSQSRRSLALGPSSQVRVTMDESGLVSVKPRNGDGHGMEEDLLTKFLEETGGLADYLEAIPPPQIKIERLIGISKRVSEEGTFLVTSHYGTLANAVAGDPAPASDVIHEAVRIIHKGLIKLKEEVSGLEGELDQFSPQDVNRLRRTLAVMIYLAHRALCGMEAKSVQYILGSGEMKSNAKKTVEGINWFNQRSMIIEDILGVLQHPVEKVWDDSGYGFSVPRLLIRTMCSNFNEACLAKENLRAGGEAYKIFAILAKRFDRETDVYQRLFPLLKYGEEVAKLVAGTVEVMVNEYELDKAVPNALKSCIELMDEISDKNVEKGVAAFVIEACQNTSDEVISKGGLHLVELLNADSACVRCAVVQGTGHLMAYLSRRTTSQARNLRRLILENMLGTHSKDINSLVRGKVLNVLSNLIDEKLLNPTEVANCMTIAIARIRDIAVLPRKYAIKVISLILAKFPGICSQTINFRQEVDSHRKRLLELLARTNVRKSYYVYAIVEEFINQIHDQKIPLSEEFESVLAGGMSKVRPVISQLIKEEKYWEACTLFFYAFETYGSEAGIEDAGKSAAKPKLYISYFNSIIMNDSAGSNSGEKSLLETTLDVSITLSQEIEEGGGQIENDEILNERKLFLFTDGCLKMKLQLDSLVEQLTLLLQAGQPNDRTEVITIFGELVRYGYPVNERVTGPIIQAIASLAQESANSLVPAFWSIFIGSEQIENVEMVKNMFKILDSVEPNTKEMLKPIIGEMRAKNSIKMSAVQVVFDAFTQKDSQWTQEDAKNAVFVIGALGRQNRKLVLSNIALLVKFGLGDEALNDYELIKLTLEALLYSLKSVNDGDVEVIPSHRFEPNARLFERLLVILVHGITKKGNWDTHQQFPKVAELAMQIIYKLCSDHAKITKQILMKIPPLVFGKSLDLLPVSEINACEEIYIRYLSIMTALLGSHINHCETVIMPEIKNRKRLIQANTFRNRTNLSSASSIAPSSATISRSTINMSAISAASSKRGGGRGKGARKNSKMSNSTTNSTSHAAMAELEAMIGSVGFDAEMETVKVYVEKLLDHGTFQQFRRLALFFCEKIASIKHYKLQEAIVQAIGKLMLVSAHSVNNLVNSFIKVWNVVTDNRVKVEMLKHLTILNVRFPNQVEQCNTIIKTGLLSDDKCLKIACLDFMGFLALGDMVKIRENIAEVALCLCSDVVQIRELARDFFNVCADKDNVISNAVPEVISRLSNKEGLPQSEFHKIMEFLLARVKKEKQVIGLVETLIVRLKGPVQNERLWEDTAYGLTQLSHNEKTFKIIVDSFQNYCEKLKNEMVYTSFINIIESLKKLFENKREAKIKLEAFEQQLDDFRTNCVEKDRIADAKHRQKSKSSRRDSTNSFDDKSSLMRLEESETEVNMDEEVENDQPDKENDQEEMEMEEDGNKTLVENDIEENMSESDAGEVETDESGSSDD